jgi:molybdopterin/thiamine biosynthesis adenylyltransferase
MKKTLDAQNVAKLLKGSELVIDCFDNSRSRLAIQEACRELGVPCLHAGLADGYGEVIWNEWYRVPSSSQDDVCDYPLARNLVTLAVSVTAESVLRFLIDRTKENWSITLRDLSIRPYGM